MIDSHDPKSPLNVPPETVTNGQMFMVLQAMNGRLSAIAAEQVRQGKKLERLETQTEGVRKAWEAGGWVIKATTAVGSVAVAIAAVWVLVTGAFTGDKP